MLRQSLGRWGALLLEQQPATAILQNTSSGMLARGMHNGATAWARAATRSSGAVSSRLMNDRMTSIASRARPFKAKSPFTSPGSQPRRTFHSSKSRKSDDKGKEEAKSHSSKKGSSGKEEAEPQSLSARMKKLSREYGWTAVGVYLGLSLIDFPFCFLLVRTLGTDKIAAAEHYIVSHVQAMIPESIKESWRNYRSALKDAKTESGNVTEGEDVVNWGVEEADAQLKKEASLATQLALAYAIHKSFIFIRVPLAAAVTPKVVKVLRSWGWKIGKQKPAK